MCINSQTEHPSALDMFEEILHLSEGKQIVMFLDYDGTLSPIVDDPDRAFMSRKVHFENQYKEIYLFKKYLTYDIYVWSDF